LDSTERLVFAGGSALKHLGYEWVWQAGKVASITGDFYLWRGETV